MCIRAPRSLLDLAAKAPSRCRKVADGGIGQAFFSSCPAAWPEANPIKMVKRASPIKKGPFGLCARPGGRTRSMYTVRVTAKTPDLTTANGVQQGGDGRGRHHGGGQPGMKRKKRRLDGKAKNMAAKQKARHSGGNRRARHKATRVKSAVPVASREPKAKQSRGRPGKGID